MRELQRFFIELGYLLGRDLTSLYVHHGFLPLIPLILQFSTTHYRFSTFLLTSGKVEHDGHPVWVFDHPLYDCSFGLQFLDSIVLVWDYKKYLKILAFLVPDPYKPISYKTKSVHSNEKAYQ